MIPVGAALGAAFTAFKVSAGRNGNGGNRLITSMTELTLRVGQLVDSHEHLSSQMSKALERLALILDRGERGG